MKTLIVEVSHCVLIANATSDLNITRASCDTRVNYFTPHLIATTWLHFVRVPMGDFPFILNEQMKYL